MKSTVPAAVDEAIDLVAREMTEVANVDLAARVLTRLEPRPVASSWLRLAAGGGVAAAAIVMVAIAWPRTPPPLAPAVTTPADLARTTTAPGPAAVNTSLLPRERQARRSSAVSAEEAGWLARAIPLLDKAPLIAIDPIQPSRPSIAPIKVEAVGPQPIDVPTIDIRNSGGR